MSGFFVSEMCRIGPLDHHRKPLLISGYNWNYPHEYIV
jgi:hypothetical protein